MRPSVHLGQILDYIDSPLINTKENDPAKFQIMFTK
jgi:hypothetical protein